MKALIGIMPENMFRERVMAIVKGLYVPNENEPKIWFSSIAALGQILNNPNIELLRTMDSKKPQTLTELAKLSGRNLSNLSNTMATFEKHGFATRVKNKGIIKPVALFTDFDITTQYFPPQKTENVAA
ncbi:MarR family transcriptional regulator [Rouxiella sp. T17]|uniref:HVO_A0114 family putative DNA-binding protein n=1 Tax=Rouxiella sp. T17 TaxID=3085684 RepID=UPI002FCAC7CD